MSKVRREIDMPANPANQPRPDRRLCNRVRSKTCMLGDGDGDADWLTVEFEDDSSTWIVNPSVHPTTNAIDGQKGSHTDCWVFVDDSEVKAAAALMAAMEKKGHIEKNSDNFVYERGGTPSDRSEGSACEHEDSLSLDEEGEEDYYTSTEDEDEDGH